ncbi:MAG: FAD-dependent oxidoreductase [Planctomycetes bacterium]|nr:FAD-dependent oxidoreductase [Planctomycetota bacterium]
MTRLDVIVIGGGLRGMRAALRLAAERPDAAVACVEARATPGDDVQSQRSNGFVCETGPFAFTREEADGWLAPLQAGPRVVSALESGRIGWLFDGTDRKQLRVEPEPCSFPTGGEDVVQAYRRQLGERLRLGRRVTAVQPRPAGGFAVHLGGEVPTELEAAEVVLAIPPDEACRVLDPLVPELAQLAERIERQPRAFVWFGGIARQAPELRGYGVLPHPSLRSPIAELIFCTEVFANRAMPGRVLVRAEVALDERPDEVLDDDAALVDLVEPELRRWTGTEAPFGFTKVHRFATVAPDGTATECRTRVLEIVAGVAGLSLAT